MVVVLSWQGAGAQAGPTAATTGVIRKDEAFTPLEKSERVALVFQNASPPGARGEGSRGWRRN